MPTCVLMQQSIPHGGTSRKQKPKIKSKIFTFCMSFWYFTFFLTTLFVYPSPPYVMSGRIWFIHLFVCLFLAVQFWTHLIIDHVKSEDTNGISSLLASASVVTIHHAVPDWGKGLRLCTNVAGIYWNQLKPIGLYHEANLRRIEANQVPRSRFVYSPRGKISHIGLNVLFRSRTSGGNLSRRISSYDSYVADMVYL